VIVVIGAGQIGQAIAQPVGIGKHVLLADMRQENTAAAAEVLSIAGFEVRVATVDVSSREAVGALVENASGLRDPARRIPESRRPVGPLLLFEVSIGISSKSRGRGNIWEIWRLEIPLG
jgi:NAD(P)-dependent dehydrogenase (short-subunit alcohol dehydrogenase family)